MDQIKIFLLVLLLLLPARIATAASTLDILLWLHNRHSVNAVNFDGNTCLQTNTIWNPPANSRWLFLNWAEAPEANNQADTIILYAASSNPNLNSVTVYETTNPYTGWADLVVDIVSYGGNYVYKTHTSPIPKNGLYHTVFVSLDTVARAGDVMTVEAPTGAFSFETLQDNPAPVTINWPVMNLYNLGCRTPQSQPQDWANMPMAEFYADLGQFHWLLPQAASDFVSQQGYSLGLSTNPASHDCAEPSATTAIPQMCHTGNGNFFPNGPEGGNGLFAYQLSTVAGALTTAPSDPCLSKGIGDGCLVP